MKRLLMVGAMLFTASACSGSFPAFSDTQHFRIYVDALELSKLSVADASAKLLALRFSCSNAQDAMPLTECTRKFSHYYGSQTQIVDLRADPMDAHRSVVTISFTSIAL